MIKIHTTMAKISLRARNAGNGQFVRLKYAEKHPDITVVEKVKVGPVKHHK